MTIVPLPAAGRDDLAAAVDGWLADLDRAGGSPHTRQAYAGDLKQFRAYHRGPLAGVTVAVLRGFFDTLADRTPATRARKQAALASFFQWAVDQGRLPADPLAGLPRIPWPAPAPRGLDPDDVERVLAAIPREQARDRLLFRLVYETGLRIGEALAPHIEDFHLARDDERVHVTGKGRRPRTVLLDDPQLVRDLRRYLGSTDRRRGPLFRPLKGGTGAALTYEAIRKRWTRYCAAAGVAGTLHQLRHTHATRLVNDDVHLETIRKRLGHRRIQTTLRYAERSGTAADAEIRAWRRRQRRR